MVINVHERRLPVSADVVGPLLDRMGSADDRLWPAAHWPPMMLTAPLAVGVSGRHGPIRYRVTAYQPGRSAEFTFAPGVGLRGIHRLEVEPTGPETCTIRHIVRGRTTGRMRLVWPVVMRWVHDAVAEDLLDQAEFAVGLGPVEPATWSPWVRWIRATHRPRAKAAAVPVTELLANALPRVDWSDAYVISCAEGAPTDPQAWADAVFRSPPTWVGGLMLAREWLVGLVGIPRGGAAAFDTLDRTAEEVLLGIDQSHLGFRASVLREPKQVLLSTVVQLHNRRGRLYFALVKRVHAAVVRTALTRAARRLAR